MKKSLLALAVVAVAASANAATVYDKDGTSLGINGRIQSVFYSGNHTGKNAAENDSQLLNTARFGLQGKTQITDWVAGIGYAQWDMDNKGTGNGTKAREQYVGADFGEFGVLTAGKFRDASYYVENVTDHYEDAAGAVQGNFNGARRAGQIMYTYDNYGFHGQLGIQTAQDSAPVFDNDKGTLFDFDNKFNVDSGYSAALGYKTGDLVFGPLDFRVGYSYLKGQKDGDAKAGKAGTYTFNNFKHAAAGVSWGNLNSGLYLAALYDYGKMKGIIEPADYVDGFDDDSFKVKGFELSGGYAFDNGVSFLIGYESAKYTLDEEGVGKTLDFKVKRIPVFVNYKLNPNFNIWTEAGFNAGSDHAEGLAKKIDKTIFSVGARYTF
ncbi:outer membrane protein N [Succinivibrio dextrinosolvens DSM 3072]|uniref:Outer membrane protein N n=1 Tax=Succinivibrio dextrinosolvens DSM 3072 TaxID=1123324 RepID=A0A1T4W1S9_9GAMM|nr:porin [Succinivibrio dextrinosolvens]SKA71220.1 outer membrane protein N [Succinivibrio dextrinosolvens DSM 3072]